MTTPSNAEQATFWSDQAGPTWVAHQARLDDLFQPVLDGVMRRAALSEGHAVLDVGCGTGASLVQAARAVGTSGHVLGADISTSMLETARTHAKGLSQVDFLLGDVAEYAFAPARFDRMISRFGVMFFADSVAAFANIAQALKPDALLSFAAWGLVQDNPWFVLPAQAAKARLGAPPPVDPDAPGPFAFRNESRVRQILADAGLTDITTEVETLHLMPPGTLAEVADLATRVGPVSRTVTHFGANETDRLAIQAMIEKDFVQFRTDDGFRIPAQINFFSARPA